MADFIASSLLKKLIDRKAAATRATAAEVSLHLQIKFGNLLLQAENDPGRVPLLRRFRALESMIKPWYNGKLSAPNALLIHQLLYELIDALTRCRVFVQERRLKLQKGQFLSFYHTVSRRFFSKSIEIQLDGIETKLRELKDSYNEQEEDDSDPPPPPPDQPPQLTRRSLTTTEIIGFDSEAKKIQDLLVNENGSAITSIGIVGMGGCGKTSLARKVFDGMKIRDKFFPRIWVCLSKILDREADLNSAKISVLREMLEELDDEAADYVETLPDGTEISVELLLNRLHQRLVGYKYLIVLDGVSCSRPVDELFANWVLPKVSSGAVIATGGREVDLKGILGIKKNLIRLKGPQKDDCSKIFQQEVSRYGKIDLDDPNLAAMMDEISAHCEGFPIVATTLAKIVS